MNSINKTDESIQVILEHGNGSDPRKDIFNYAVKNDWTILEMSASKRNLEDIFRHLTNEGESADA